MTKNMTAITSQQIQGHHYFSTALPIEPTDDAILYDGVNARADIKMKILSEAKHLANKSHSLHQSSKRTTNELNEQSVLNFYNNWIQHEVQLSDAYSKAIKYTARLRKEDVAKKAQRLLDDMISRHSSIQEESNFLSTHDGPQFSDRTVVDLVAAIEQDFSASAAPDAVREGIPVPTTRDFHNVLHSWASSKVKRKGLHAESLLYRMMELAYFYPENFSMPDSKSFGLAVKCYAGSTCKYQIGSFSFIYPLMSYHFL